MEIKGNVHTVETKAVTLTIGRSTEHACKTTVFACYCMCAVIYALVLALVFCGLERQQRCHVGVTNYFSNHSETTLPDCNVLRRSATREVVDINFWPHCHSDVPRAAVNLLSYHTDRRRLENKSRIPQTDSRCVAPIAWYTKLDAGCEKQTCDSRRSIVDNTWRRLTRRGDTIRRLEFCIKF